MKYLKYLLVAMGAPIGGLIHSAYMREPPPTVAEAFAYVVFGYCIVVLVDWHLFGGRP